MVDLLHHFTSASGLKGILASGNLHATHIAFLNDSTENNIAHSYLEQKLTESFLKFVNSDARLSASLEIDCNTFARGQAANFIKSTTRITEQLSPIFVTSFSLYEDAQDLERGTLGQWRSYGPEGGYCLVFDKIKLVEMLSGTDAENLKFATRVSGKIHYAEAGKEIDIPVPSAELEHYFKMVMNKYSEDSPIYPGIDGNNLEVPARLANLTMVRIPFIKHASFSEEREFRFCVAALTPNTANRLAKPVAPYLFKTRGQTLIPYVELFDQNSPLPIVKVIVGPHPMVKTRVKAVELLLESLSYKGVTVTTSEIPYESVW